LENSSKSSCLIGNFKIKKQVSASGKAVSSGRNYMDMSLFNPKGGTDIVADTNFKRSPSTSTLPPSACISSKMNQNINALIKI
jgi:hypothetical protein